MLYIKTTSYKKFENDCLKAVGGDRFLMKLSTFAFLVFAFHKKPNELSGFDHLSRKLL